MLTKANVFIGATPKLCIVRPEPDAGVDFDPGLLPELLEHGLIDPLDATEGQWRLIKELTVQRQNLEASLQARRQGNNLRADKFQDFEMKMQKVIELEHSLYSSFSLKQKQVARQLLKDQDIL